jgi:hypothetical protein
MLLLWFAALTFASASAENFAQPSVVFPQQAADLIQNKAAAIQNKAISMPCNSILLQSCQAQFNRYLGIQDTLDWHDATTFYAAINSRIYNNTAGLLRVCGAYSLLYQCLGQTYSSCINPLYFIASQYSISQSFQYVQAIHALMFKCNGGLEQSVMKWAGIIQVYQTQTASMEACFNTFNTSINQNFDNYCTAVYHLENCFSSLFTALGSEVVWWACEDIRVGFSYTFCPDSGNLVCTILRKKAQELSTGKQKHENDRYHLNLGLTQIVFDHPPEPNEETV